MPQAFYIKYADKKDEILQHTEDFGQLETMQEYGIHDIFAFKKMLAKWGKDENFGRFPRYAGLTNINGINMFSVVAEKIRDFKQRKDQQITEMANRIEQLEAENQVMKRWLYKNFGKQLTGLLEILEES